MRPAVSDPLPDRVDPARRRGRGAASARSGRFEPAREAVDDGWGTQDEPLPPLRTEVTEERVRSAIARNTSPDVPFDRSLNPYRGCEHGCIYCFARPTHAYLGLSPGLDFETRLVARPNIAEVLARELGNRGYRPATIALGTATDPYQPVERERRLTRACLEVLDAAGHPVGIVTKGALVERDIDILAPMAARGILRVGFSVTTLDPDLARRMEPRAPSPARRLAAIRRLSEAGVPVRVMVSPIVPGLTDHEIEAILAEAAAAGAVAASWVMLRLPREVSELWQEWLAEHRPDRAARVMARLREMHGGRDYAPDWGHRMRGEGVHAEMIAQRFAKAARRAGLAEHLPPLRTDAFAPLTAGAAQLRLF
ncbi:radical SAM protein [Rhodosalinus halophilus]|uniref:Radical SAM protein n=1 Tax=Rhodosalinus halophilus TaxID=2259333 RepID=A0A365UDH0_9RHOB|nr:PA0069 family radical SAM protein [Rhodosalinus halophilus]RBI86745.1 radical SAM protein [Rhodosalinus halophilus]